MLGIEDYGSDSDSDVETQPTPSSSTQKLSAKLPAPSNKSAFPLPPPVNSGGAASSSSTKRTGGLSLPAPKAKRPKRITIGLPELPPEDDKVDAADEPPPKKPRIESGTRSSALLSMLPAPKNKAPVQAPQERVLGSGRGPGLVFNTGSRKSSHAAVVEDAGDDAEEGIGQDAANAEPVEEGTTRNAALPFLPPSLAKGKANVSVEERVERAKVLRPTVSSAPAVDFFSLGFSSSASTSRSTQPGSSAPFLTSTAPSPSAPTSSKPLLPGLSAAPKVDDFSPPEPTPQDPYPGYYLLPSGAWAAYDPAYYKTFYDKWKKDYDSHVRALEKGTAKGFEDLETEGAQEVNALKEMERAKQEIQEREERKALTTGSVDVPDAPKMNIKGAALGGRARSRHQLSTLLTEAYQNREALEEKIAQGRRNRKEAGNKYGF